MLYPQHFDEFKQIIPRHAGRPASGKSQARMAIIYSAAPLPDSGAGLAAEVWLHNTVSWHWDGFHYRSESHAWTTDSKDGGNPVVVQRIAAYLHDTIGSDGPPADVTDVRQNASEAHATYRKDLLVINFGFQNCGQAEAEVGGTTVRTDYQCTS